MSKKGQKPGDLSNTINNIKKSIDDGFDELVSRVSALEASDKVNSMDIRNLQIQMRAARGDKQADIARTFDLSEGRVSQIINERE